MSFSRCLFVGISICQLAMITSSANAGHCDFMLYSEFLGRSLKVCQTADTIDQCGVWPTSGRTSRVMAMAEGKDLELLDLIDGDCSEERVVGSCLLGTGNLVFYEGEPRDLETGCNAMQGTWQVSASDTTAVETPIAVETQ